MTGVHRRIALSSMGAMLLAYAFFTPFAHAQSDRSYAYDAIRYDITVRKDAAIRVVERQTYEFKGEYHQAVRFIPRDGFGYISDITVSDEEGNPYTYSDRRLDKENPASWGKYTSYEDGGYTYIEWYYDMRNPGGRRTWIVEYTAHGAVAFYPDHDELYWNLFTAYDVPVARVEAYVRLPQEVTTPSQTLYRSDGTGVAEFLGAETFRFTAENIKPGEALTIAAGWQKGIVSKGAFWRSWFIANAAYVLSVVLLAASIIFALIYWFFSEKYRKGRGTIIPEYTPPQNLRPAMAELIATERLGSATWAATIVDLAVRGYVKIVKDTKPGKTGISLLDRLLTTESFLVEKVRDWSQSSDVEEYEKAFLDILFEDDPKTFSTAAFTKKTQGSMSASWDVQKKMQELTKKLYAETSGDTGAYEVPLTVRNWRLSSSARVAARVWSMLLILGVAMFAAASATFIDVSYAALAAAIPGAAFIVFYAIRLNPRLNDRGFRLRDDWQGFKLYLETAEKYRMQNLTPELFEKYLPYAMIFGIEKKWAKAFDSISMRQPAWYGTSGSTAAFASGDAGGFSPSLFSASFSSSFTSAISSSAGGGASGGGGGAGGGGGGGGGGAS